MYEALPHSTSRPPAARTTARNEGFSLVELLVVIVILGILTTVAVFAIRGITDKGQDNAEASDLRTIETAVEAYYVDYSANPTEQELLDGGYIRELSSLHNLAVAGDGTYSIANVRTGNIVSTGSGGGGSVAAAISGAPRPVGGLTAYTSGAGAGDIVWFGGAQTRAVWNAAIDAGRTVAPTGFVGGDQLVFMDIASIPNLAALELVMADVDANLENWWIVPEDDVADFCLNTDGDLVPFSVCVETAIINNGAVSPGINSWPLANVDPLWNA